MKIAPFVKAIINYNLSASADSYILHLLCHTGQHYDDNMSKAFFEQLNIPEADINFGIGSGTHAEQVGQTMIAFEKVLKEHKPDWVVVVGDVNATLACSVTAKKEWVKCCHIEANLRSGDLKMPEEINRLVTDRISDLLLTPDKISITNLQNEGVEESRICFVGNIMIDTLEQNREKASSLSINDIIKVNRIDENVKFRRVEDGEFTIVTLHRPSNVDNSEILTHIINFINEEVTTKLNVIWPIHPRTLNRLNEFDLFDLLMMNKRIILTKPLGYLEMLRLNMSAKLILTDSGGLQEKCTVLGTPCLTLRWNTERPVTLREFGGASVLVGNNIEKNKSRVLYSFYN
ncbi:MAG: UDP-N-acetylglucosamine 2-epimerase (non-hydrolyzing) [Flavobacterium sp.]|nr:UDP-N-acetylglucosamine 2-epimerase (non-hydrolyzing) [Flavobacterium sp.]